MNTVIKFVDKLSLDIGSKFTDINNGGCGFTAFYFYKYLIKLNSKDICNIQIKTANCEWSDVDSLPLKLIIRFFKRKNIIPKSIDSYFEALNHFSLDTYDYNFLSHLVCTFECNNISYVIDTSYGVMTSEEYCKLSSSKISKQYWDTDYLIRLLNNRSNWNSRFDRSNLQEVSKIFKSIQ